VFLLVEVAEAPLGITPFPERVADLIRVHTGADVKRVMEALHVKQLVPGVDTYVAEVKFKSERG
jgi:hypothetical protein